MATGAVGVPLVTISRAGGTGVLPGSEGPASAASGPMPAIPNPVSAPTASTLEPASATARSERFLISVTERMPVARRGMVSP